MISKSPRVPNLVELIKLLENMVKAEDSQANMKHITETIVRLMSKKRNRFQERYNITLYNWDDALKASPDQIATFLENPEFQIILKRDVEITFLKSAKQKSIYSTDLDVIVENVRSKGRIVFANPLRVIDSNRAVIQSWARAKSISHEYNRHLSISRAPKKSKFLKGAMLEDIEYELFPSALAILKSPDQMFMYGYFDSEIGTLPNKEKTRYVKMQCDRGVRSSGRGYFTEIHSYPISEKEIHDELRSCSNFLDLLHQQPLPKNNYFK